MNQGNKINERIFEIEKLESYLRWWRLINKTIAFTNGVFDLLHEGHIKVLSEAASFTDILIVGINSDASVKRLKGESRPVHNQQTRSLVVASMIMVDAVTIFEEDTPLEIIRRIKPDVLVKGGDYKPQDIVGAKEVISSGGVVHIIPLVPGFSTSQTIEKMKRP